MRKLILGTLAFLAFQSAHANSIKVQCNFTEPFITVAFDESTSKMVHYLYGDKAQTVEAEAFRTDKNTVLILSEDRAVKLELFLDKKGNDGMSDREYAYEGILNDNLYGGCDNLK